MASLSSYAVLADCISGINVDETSNFFRIWCFCIALGVALMVVFAVPMYWFIAPTHKEDRKFLGDGEPIVPAPHVWKDPEEAKAAQKPPARQATNIQVDDPQPDVTTAREHLRATSNTDEDGKWRGLWSTSFQDIEQIGGVGMMLYFRLLQGLGICFCFMTVFTSPTALFSYHGNFAPDMGQPLAKMTIGNLGTIAPADISQEDRFVIVSCQGLDIKQYTAIFGYLDAMAIVLFLIFILKFYFQTLPSVVRDADADRVSIVDFAIEIDQLPARINDQAAYLDLLTQHVLGRLEVVRRKRKPRPDEPELPPVKVCELCLVRDYGGRLGTIKSRAKLLYKKEISEFKGDTKRVNKMQAKIDKLSTKLQGALGADEELPVVRAYCVLNCVQDVEGLQIYYRFSRFKLLRCCQRRDSRFQGKAIRVREAPEPTNIIPENQDVRWWDRAIRILVMFVLWSIALSISACLIFLIGMTAKGESQANASQLGSATCDSGTSVAADAYKCDYQVAKQWNITQAHGFNGDQLSCFCLTQGYTQVIDNAELRDGLCKDWLQDAAAAASKATAASVVTVIINAVFNIFIVLLAAWEKPDSVSALNSSLMWKTFASQFLNMAVIIFVLNFHSSEISILNGDYAGFERGWYSVVGGAMMLNLLFNSFVSSVIYLAKEFVKRLGRCICCRSKIKHQAELLKLYTGHPFDISSCYAQMLTTVFCTLLYSPGLPLVPIFAAAYCFLRYWVDKWSLLRACCRPPLFDASMAKTASRLMIWAVPMHCAAAIGMFSDACTFPSNPLGGSLATMSQSAQAAGQTQDTEATGGWGERMTRESTWVMTILLLLTVVGFVVWLVLFVVGATCGRVWTACVYACCPSQAVDDAEDDVAASMSWEGGACAMVETQTPPASYVLERHPEFSGLVQHLRAGDDAAGAQLAPYAAG